MLRDAAAYTINNEDDIESAHNLTVKGLGLHSASLNCLKISSKKLNHWIEFSAYINGKNYRAPALWTRLSGTTRSTALVLRGSSRNRLELRTIEHFMAAAFVFDLNGCEVEIESDQIQNGILEVPILDGSSKEWSILKKFQSLEVPKLRPVWLAVKDFSLKDGNKEVRIRVPENNYSTQYFCQVDFGPHWIQEKSFSIDWMNPAQARELFEKEIAPARTFGFKAELDDLVRRGLIKGASLENALLLDDNSVVNTSGFRVPQELAAHKLLDGIGDLALLGKPVIASIDFIQAGHYLHLRALDEAVRQEALRPALLNSMGQLSIDESAHGSKF